MEVESRIGTQTARRGRGLDGVQMLRIRAGQSPWTTTLDRYRDRGGAGFEGGHVEAVRVSRTASGTPETNPEVDRQASGDRRKHPTYDSQQQVRRSEGAGQNGHG